MALGQTKVIGISLGCSHILMPKSVPYKVEFVNQVIIRKKTPIPGVNYYPRINTTGIDINLVQ